MADEPVFASVDKTPTPFFTKQNYWIHPTPSTYGFVIHIRSFAPWDWFGPVLHGHQGDDRGFSTAADVTSRIAMEILYALRQNRVVTHRVDAGWSVGADLRSPKMKNAITKSHAAGTVEGRATSSSASTIAASYEGNLSLAPGSADIDVSATITIGELPALGAKEPRLGVKITVRGDGFPFLEAFIRDSSKQCLFLTTFKPDMRGARTFGPLVKLPFRGTGHMASGKLEVTLDASGNFRQVYDETVDLAKKSTWNGPPRLIDLDSWNSYFVKGTA